MKVSDLPNYWAMGGEVLAYYLYLSREGLVEAPVEALGSVCCIMRPGDSPETLAFFRQVFRLKGAVDLPQGRFRVPFMFTKSPSLSELEVLVLRSTRLNLAPTEEYAWEPLKGAEYRLFLCD